MSETETADQPAFMVGVKAMQLNRRYLFLSTLGLRSIELSPSYSCIAMVCSKCERKLSKLATPDPFNVTSSKEGKRKIADNTLLSMRGRGVGSSAAGAKGKGRYSPYAAKKCVDCNSNVSQNNAKYCHSCAFKKGLCSICGKAVLDTTLYSMSAK